MVGDTDLFLESFLFPYETLQPPASNPCPVQITADSPHHRLSAFPRFLRTRCSLCTFLFFVGVRTVLPISPSFSTKARLPQRLPNEMRPQGSLAHIGLLFNPPRGPPPPKAGEVSSQSPPSRGDGVWEGKFKRWLKIYFERHFEFWIRPKAVENLSFDVLKPHFRVLRRPPPWWVGVSRPNPIPGAPNEACHVWYVFRSFQFHPLPTAPTRFFQPPFLSLQSNFLDHPSWSPRLDQPKPTADF